MSDKAIIEWRGIPLAVEFTYYKDDDSIDIDYIAVLVDGEEVDEIDEFINNRAEGEILDSVRDWIDLQNEEVECKADDRAQERQYFIRGVHC